MIHVCSNCSLYAADMTIIGHNGESMAVCPHCAHAQPFLQLPLYIVTGASGSGKSTCIAPLICMTREFVVLETDILWEPRYNLPEDKYRTYREMWLRIAMNISQSGRPVILCGTALPEQLEFCIERRYFSEIHYLALICSGDRLEQRLKERPSWRNSADETFLQEMLRFNQWFKTHGPTLSPPLELLDTTFISPVQTAEGILNWSRNLCLSSTTSAELR